MNSKVVTSRAPVRIDFAGPWTDVPKFAASIPGLVVNAAITLYTYVTIKQKTDKTVRTSLYGYPIRTRVHNNSIFMYSVDLDKYVDVGSVWDIEYNGTLDLVKAACKRLSKSLGGIEIVTRSEAPPGSGLGTSASMGVALIGALLKYAGEFLSRAEIADMAFRLETEELKLLSGTQDQYSAVYGGVACWRCYGDRVLYDPILLESSLRLELEKRLVLCYTGQSRLSSDIHFHVNEEFDRGGNHFPLTKLVQTAEIARKALYVGDLDLLSDAMNQSWIWQKQLHSSVTNEVVESFFTVATVNGMQAGKACGAGGGGCLLFLAKEGEEHILRRALEDHGGQILNLGFSDYGLCVWE